MSEDGKKQMDSGYVFEVEWTEVHSWMDGYEGLSPEDFPEWAHSTVCYFSFSITMSSQQLGLPAMYEKEQ